MTTPLKIALMIAMAAFYAFFGGRAVYLARKRGRPGLALPERANITASLHAQGKAALVAIGTVVCLYGFVWLSHYSEGIIAWMVHTMGLRNVQMLMAFMVFALGSLAYWFKQMSPLRYGTVEIVFGVAASAIAIQHIDVKNFFPTFATLGGCVYIVAQGIGNVWEAFDKEDTRHINLSSPSPSISRLASSNPRNPQ